jgi:hypothetical protein
MDARQCRNYLLDYSVSEVFLLRIAAHVLEWQHRIDGLSGSMSGDCDGVSIAGSEGLGRSPSRMRWTRIGRAMFLTCCSPMSSNRPKCLAFVQTIASDGIPTGIKTRFRPGESFLA